MSLTLLAANNAQTVLAAGISSSAISLTVNTGTGSLFPSPVAETSFFKLTIIDAATGSLTEIVHVTARNGDVFTIQRGQEGTIPRSWSANDIAANMMTAGTLSYILGNFQPLDPTLTALAALVGVANKLPYFNGDDTAALTDLTQVGRDIIGKSSIADILTYLGLRKSVSESGFFQLVDFQIVWGRGSTGSNGIGNVQFPHAFADTPYLVMPSDISSGPEGVNAVGWDLSNSTAAGARIFSADSKSSGIATTFSYIAIGKGVV